MLNGNIDKMISVIIPTYNGADLLRKSLVTWAHQTLPTNQYEVIVVDNNSTEDIQSVVEEVKNKRLEVQDIFRYVKETIPGATAARHRGVRESTGEYLVFADNDGLYNPECLEEILKVYQGNLECVAVSCKIDIIWDEQEPDWIGPYKYLLGQLDEGDKVLYRHKLYLNGGLMSVRRDVFERLHGFNPDLVGPYLIGDGDTGLVRKIHKEGLLIGWAPNAHMYHMQQVSKHGTVAGVALHTYNNGVAESYAKYREEDFVMNRKMYAYLILQLLALCKKWIQSRVMYRDDKALYFSYQQKVGAVHFFGLLLTPELKKQIQVKDVY